MSHRVLLIQHDRADAMVVQRALSTNSTLLFRLQWVTSFRAGLDALEADQAVDKAAATGIAAILVDLLLLNGAGADAFDLLFKAARHIPILVLSAEHDEDRARLAVQLGAQDYLLKNRVDNYDLPKALTCMIERTTISGTLHNEDVRAHLTLNSIGDAVVSTGIDGRITYLNEVAEAMTGWSLVQAAGQPLEQVFRLVDGHTRAPVISPMEQSIRDNTTVVLPNDCLLIRRDGTEVAIEDSAAPIHDLRGQTTGAVMVFHDVSTARALTVRMSFLANHDVLTSLPNRLLFNDRLSQAIAHAHRHQTQLAVLFVDVDNFKRINDSMGHAVGDQLLQSVAQRLVSCLRSSDTVSRLGGDEFVVLLSELSQATDAAASAEKILTSLGQPYCIDGHDLHVDASIGIATYPADAADAISLLTRADTAMYSAKGSGGGTCRMFTQAMHALKSERHGINAQLHSAIERREFELHYQPRVNLHTGAIIGVEALVRWRHPQRGLLLPATFMPVAEESGLIVPIGRWVLQEACRQAVEWQRAGHAPLRIAVNLSAVEVRASGFLASVRAILAETGVAPRVLDFEVTEPLLLQDSRFTAGILRALRGMGSHLVLDDFGTGYSSLSHLRRFPIDTLKIDPSLLHAIAADSHSGGMVGAVIGIGSSLQLRVVAEGVETHDQLVFLRERGCQEGQGNYFSPPVIARGMHPLLAITNFPPPLPTRSRQRQLGHFQPISGSDTYVDATAS